MAVDAHGTAVRPRLSERQSFFGGAISTREASAARRWDTLFEEPPPETDTGSSRPGGGNKGAGAQVKGGYLKAGSFAAPTEVFRDVEADKKQKRAAQLADFELLGSEQPAAAQPQRTPHGAGASKGAGNGASGRSVAAASRDRTRQPAGGVTTGAPLQSSAVRQARLANSGHSSPVSAPAMRGPSAGLGRTSSPMSRPMAHRVTGAACSSLGANRRIATSSCAGVRGSVSKITGSKARVHTTKGGRKAAASRASAVAIVPSGTTRKQRATAAWTAAVAKMLPPPGSRKSDLVAQQQDQQRQNQQQPTQAHSSRLLAGLSIQSGGATTSSAPSSASKVVSCPVQLPGSRPAAASRPSAAAAAGRSSGHGAPAARPPAAAGRGGGPPASRQLALGRGGGGGRGSSGAPAAMRVQAATSFYPGGGSSSSRERVRGPTAASQAAQRAYGDYGDDTFDNDLIDDGGDVDSELEDDIGDGGEDDWRAELRAITGYDPAKFSGERVDDRNMEVRNWGAVQAEERRSAREGAREDAEAEREELARLAKKKEAKLAARRRAAS